MILPIWIPCEGSGYPTAGGGSSGICAMCGTGAITLGLDGNVLPHRRRDILAMIDRGDFANTEEGST